MIDPIAVWRQLADLTDSRPLPDADPEACAQWQERRAAVWDQLATDLEQLDPLAAVGCRVYAQRDRDKAAAIRAGEL